MREPQHAWELGGKATMDQSLCAVGISQSWSSKPRWCDLTFRECGFDDHGTEHFEAGRG